MGIRMHFGGTVPGRPGQNPPAVLEGDEFIVLGYVTSADRGVMDELRRLRDAPEADEDEE